MSQSPLIRWIAGVGVAQHGDIRCTLAVKPDLGFPFDDVFYNAGSGTLRYGADEAHDLTPEQVAACEAWLSTLAQFSSDELVHACDDDGAPLGLVPKSTAPHITTACPDGDGWRWDFIAARWLRQEDINAFRVQAVDTIDAEAEAARLRFITNGAGQAATYLVKAEQARAFIASEGTGVVPPFIAAEVAATGLDPLAAAELIAGIAAHWQDTIAPAIERERRGANLAIAAAQSAGEIGSAMRAGILALKEIRP